MTNLKKLGKRGLALFIALMLLVGVVPFGAMAADNNSKVTKSAFENAYNLGQSDTCRGIVKLDGGSVTDSGTPNVWPTGNWEGAVNVTGYNWVHITNTNPSVATVSYKTEGGKLSITFTPGTATGTTKVSVGVDAKYPHYSLGTWNMELNFDYTVTNGSSNVTGTSIGEVTRSVTYNLNNDNITWNQGEMGDGSCGVGILSDVPDEYYDWWGNYHCDWYTCNAWEIQDIAVGDYDTSIATVEAYAISAPHKDDIGSDTMLGVGIEVTGLKVGKTQVVVTPKFTIPVSFDDEGYAVEGTRTMPITVYITVTGEKQKIDYKLTYNANGGSVGEGEDALTTWNATQSSTEDSAKFTVNDVTPTREGYTFKGWADTANATEAKYQAGSEITLAKSNPSKTIYAVWEENEPEVPNLYGITKELVSETPAEVNVDDEVTLTYKITVTGDLGAKYSVSDPGATLVEGSNWDGTLGRDGKAVIFVTKTVTATEAGTLTVTNTAYVKPGDNTEPIDPKDPEDGHPSNEVKTEVPVAGKEPEKVTVTVKWVDEDGKTLLDGPKTFYKGETEPTTDVTPTKGEDENYTYKFDKWDRSEDKDGNVTYRATYTATPKTPVVPDKVTITVKFVDENGKVVGTETKEVDKDDKYDVTEETEKIPEGYEPNGEPTGAPVKGTADGDKTVTVPVKTSTTVPDPTTEKVTITVEFVDENGKVVGTETKEVDKDGEYDVTEETKKVPNGYEPNGEPTGDPVTGTADDNKTVTVPVKKPVTTPVNPPVTTPPTQNPTPSTQPTESPEPSKDPGIDIEDPDTPLGPTPDIPGPSDDPGIDIPDDPGPLGPDPILNLADHYSYLRGYPDGSVAPQGSITRAEVATIFFRLLTDDARVENWSTSNDFSDVKAGSWYNNAISTIANANILKGYADGTALPNAKITRQEFAAIVSRFLDDSIVDPGTTSFTDIGGWAAADIRRVEAAGLMQGDKGMFRPYDNITRAEVAAVVNRMLQRKPDADHMHEDMKKWPDNPESAWYYADIQEATNYHTCDKFDDNPDSAYESWSEVMDWDWGKLEKEWAENDGHSVPDSDLSWDD